MCKNVSEETNSAMTLSVSTRNTDPCASHSAREIAVGETTCAAPIDVDVAKGCTDEAIIVPQHVQYEQEVPASSGCVAHSAQAGCSAHVDCAGEEKHAVLYMGASHGKDRVTSGAREATQRATQEDAQLGATTRGYGCLIDDDSSQHTGATQSGAAAGHMSNPEGGQRMGCQYTELYNRDIRGRQEARENNSNYNNNRWGAEEPDNDLLTQLRPLIETTVLNMTRAPSSAGEEKDEVIKCPMRLPRNLAASKLNNVPYFRAMYSNMGRRGGKWEFEAYNHKKYSWEEYLPHFEAHAALMGYTEADLCFQLWQSVNGDRAIMVKDVNYIDLSYESVRRDITQKMMTKSVRASKMARWESLTRERNEEYEFYLQRVKLTAVEAFPELKYDDEALFHRVLDRYAVSASRLGHFGPDLILMRPQNYEQMIHMSYDIDKANRMRSQNNQLARINAIPMERKQYSGEQEYLSISSASENTRETQKAGQYQRHAHPEDTRQINDKGNGDTTQKRESSNQNYNKPWEVRDMSRVKCNLCHQLGHFVNKCPRLREAERWLNGGQTTRQEN